MKNGPMMFYGSCLLLVDPSCRLVLTAIQTDHSCLLLSIAETSLPQIPLGMRVMTIFALCHEAFEDAYLA
jgi:hypothetical protein